MVRSYLRHGPTQAFGLICSPSSNSLSDGQFAYVPALEDVLVWDIKKSKMISMWHDTGVRVAVTCIAASPLPTVFAVGYSDGSIRIWDSASSSVTVRFNGHKRSITALAFDSQGLRLASGSQDTDIIIWDVVAGEGLKRLSGHRDQITTAHFLPQSQEGAQSRFLLTSSKDTLLKLWDLSSWQCVETVVGHRSEVWSLDISPSGQFIFSGSSEGEVKGWRLDHANLEIRATSEGETSGNAIQHLGQISLKSSQRVSHIQFHPTRDFVCLQSQDRSIEVFRIRSDDEIRKKFAKRKKRRKEKAAAEGQAEEQEDVEEPANFTLEDILSPYYVLRPSGKVRSFSFIKDKLGRTPDHLTLFTALSNNALELHTVSLPRSHPHKGFTPESTRSSSLDLPGHRTDIRALSLTRDDALLASASNGQVKLWNLKTLQCIRTIACGYVLCMAFLPGDRQLAIGTKAGQLVILDIASSEAIWESEAHEGAIWSLHIQPDGQCLATGSADKTVKIWDIRRKVPMRREDIPVGTGDNEPPVTLVHSKTVKMSDEVLAIRYSPNAKYLAVALLDSTVSIFYRDSLKFYLSLYGHKLPVLSMDISHDSKLLVTSSADKNIKIWGLDFGDCHKSLFAHDEGIMQVAFEAQSHYFWSVSKDRMLKYWDGDKFVNIQRLEGHHGEVWALAASNEGKFVVTASHDKSIRVWEKLEDPLFLEEEREKELEELYEGELANSLNKMNVEKSDNDQTGIEAGTVSKQTKDTLMAGERIVEALDLADKEVAAWRDYDELRTKLSEETLKSVPPPQRDPVLVAYDMEHEEYVLSVLEKIPTSSLPDALLVLPFTKVLSLLVYLSKWAEKEMNIPLVSHVLFFLLKVYHRQIASNRVMRSSLIPLRKHLREALQKRRNLIAYNLAAMKFMLRSVEANSEAHISESLDESLPAGNSTIHGIKRKRVAL